ncbi:putative Ulp1 protease family catalytic domain-containing protein [Rosa chinensis]|uniref:Putative Ulp1 protease family catalytic domain-containing protein n=1 Tax=Rosa chinensis TaxID=74649 RepID=A0A2P6QW99_ROSCH|nr:putative Ulp1 protease family catalytic domain-containing protein [Rosa chinensis]
MRNAQTIICEFDEKIFGHPSKTFICKHDINNFVTMKEVSGSCIGIYIRYLYCVLKKTKMVDMVGFMDNTDVGAIGCGSPIERSRAIADRLKRAKRGQIILVPYNSGCHWMLTVLSPEEDIVYFMDPLKRRLCTGEWKNIVDNGIKIHNAQLKRQGRKTTTWKNCAGIPEQKTDKDCGYYVMRYMKEIVEDKSLDFFTKWERRGKTTYTQEDIDVVRNEWAKFMVKTYM